MSEAKVAACRDIDELYRHLRALPVTDEEDLGDAVDQFLAEVHVHRVSGGYDRADASTWRHEPGPDLSSGNVPVADWQARRNRLIELRGGW